MASEVDGWLKFLLIVAIYISGGYLVTFMLVIFSLLFFIFNLGDASNLFSVASQVFFVTFMIQFFIFRYIYKRI